METMKNRRKSNTEWKGLPVLLHITGWIILFILPQILIIGDSFLDTRSMMIILQHCNIRHHLLCKLPVAYTQAAGASQGIVVFLFGNSLYDTDADCIEGGLQELFPAYGR